MHHVIAAEGKVHGKVMGVGQGTSNSRLGWLDLVDLPLELMPGRRGRRGSARHLHCVKKKKKNMGEKKSQTGDQPDR